MAKFTDKYLRGLKPPKSGQVDHWDDLLPSFGIRIGSTGRKSFFVWTRVRGVGKRITLKPPYDQISLADARVQARQIIADAQAGIGPELRKKREEAGTFGSVAEAFMQDHAKHLRTKGEIQRKINVDLAELHERQISEITRADIKELVRVQARTSPVAANRSLALIAKIFNWAVKEELVQSSPAIQIDRPGQEVERERTLTADEIKIAWGAFDQVGYPFGDVFKFLLVTGQRRGEVAGMKWTELHADGWRLPGDRAKNGKGHLIPLSSLAREILKGGPQIGEFVFRAHHDTPLTGWSRPVKRVQKLCDLAEPWHLHDLRRTCASHLRSLGIDRLIVSKLLNHAEGGITRIYDRYTGDSEKTAAMERWANRLREIIDGSGADNVVQMRV